MDVYLGIDWGGTCIKAGIVTARGKLLKKHIYQAAGLSSPAAFIAEIAQMSGDFKGFRIVACGVGAPGIINIPQGFIYDLPNVKGWHDFPLKAALEKRLRLPVFVDNDANLFGLAEARLGAAKGCDNSICLTLGTGLGASVMTGGRMLEARTSAAELAHVPVVLGGEKCGCGGRGCIETFVGNRYLLAHYRRLRPKKPAAEVKDIYDLAKGGDWAALKVWKDFSYALGMFLAGMVNIFNPEVIVFGGGVSGAFDLFAPMVKKVIKDQALRPQFEGLVLKPAKLALPGVIGAGLLAEQRLRGL